MSKTQTTDGAVKTPKVKKEKTTPVVTMTTNESPAVTTAPAKEVKVKGRPPVPGSKRQLKLAEMAAKKASGEEIKRGRPADPTSKRQERLAAQEARKASGQPIKVGRPKGSGKPKEEASPAVQTPAE